jgi:hypothetical protein
MTRSCKRDLRVGTVKDIILGVRKLVKWGGIAEWNSKENSMCNEMKERKRGPSTAQANHPTGSGMEKKKLACCGRDDRFVVALWKSGSRRVWL